MRFPVKLLIQGFVGALYITKCRAKLIFHRHDKRQLAAAKWTATIAALLLLLSKISSAAD
ncbi:hypothetical protein EB241_09095 [Erwinia psidii]|uniref:Uncharacterized protein n=1 Tax=Erwinia psidii TaxID=69224 RepID=A0A3N6UQX5_9GAMM|nr:hypothetical protein EB241_09095 [Erwinia psidii]